MPEGSRSRTGCITCRIRKKKCDEQRPNCLACRSRQLTCYGYAEPPPPWYTNKPNWKDVRISAEAKALKALAETRYRIRRKVGLEANDSNIRASPTSIFSDANQNAPLQSHLNGLTLPLSSSRGFTTGPNTWQLEPDTLWWDSILQSLVPEPHSSPREETRLLMLYVDVIHPITHTFYPVSSNRDRSWLLNRVIGNEALYRSALSVSACFEHSLTQPPKTDEIGICDRVRGLQSAAVQELHAAITRYVTAKEMPMHELIWEGIRLLDAVLGLLNLECFSMLAGAWQLHYRAARMILNHIELQSPVTGTQNPGLQTLPIESALRKWDPEDERKRSLEFCILNYIWVDVIATATFGSHAYPACAFDYLPLIEDKTIRIQDIVGCHAWIIAAIVKIVRLENWKRQQPNQLVIEHELTHRANEISDQITSGLTTLENEKQAFIHAEATGVEERMCLISILFAHAAQILLQVFLLDPNFTSGVGQVHVGACLRNLEELPTRLRIRATFPYTIAGCMSIRDSQHQRFRQILEQTMQEHQPPGMAWKGLIVMEECWRLRQMRNGPKIGWRETMEYMQAMVLLV